MKLVIAVIQDKDSSKLLNKLVEKGHRATKLASTGGFLKEGNTTLFLGVEDDKIDDVLEIIKGCCKTREQIMTSVSPLVGPAESYVPYPVEISVGGATIFVVNVAQYIKV